MLFNLKNVSIRQQPATYTMKSGQEQFEIEKVFSEKDLGVIIDKALIFSKINKANRNLGNSYIHGQGHVSEIIQIHSSSTY